MSKANAGQDASAFRGQMFLEKTQNRLTKTSEISIVLSSDSGRVRVWYIVCETVPDSGRDAESVTINMAVQNSRQRSTLRTGRVAVRLR